MQRHNLFQQHHKAVKAMFHDAALSLKQKDLSNPEEAWRISKMLTTVVQLNDDLVQHESAFVFSAIDAYEPAIVDALKQDRVQALAFSEKWHKVAGSIDFSVSRVFLRFVFMDYRDYHICLMAKKEAVVNPVLWHYYTDQELKDLEQEMIGTLPEEQLQFINRWQKANMEEPGLQEVDEGEAGIAETKFRKLLATAENALYHSVQAGNRTV